MTVDNPTRRKLLAGLLGVTTGCLGQSPRSETTTPNKTTTTATDSYVTTVDCTHGYQNSTEYAVREYQSFVQGFGEITDIVGTPEQFEVDSVMGNSAFYHLNCSSDVGDCDTEFLTAIEDFQRAQQQASDVWTGFEQLSMVVEQCAVEQSELFTEQIANGKTKAKAYLPALEKFIKSAKRHVDEELSEFEGGEVFEEGLDQYKQARQLPIMSPNELEKRVDVYNG